MSESARLPTHSQDTNSSSHSHYSCRKCVGTHNKQSNLITSSSIRRLRGFLFSILSDYNIYHLLQPFIFSCYSHSYYPDTYVLCDLIFNRYRSKNPLIKLVVNYQKQAMKVSHSVLVAALAVSQVGAFTPLLLAKTPSKSPSYDSMVMLNSPKKTTATVSVSRTRPLCMSFSSETGTKRETTTSPQNKEFQNDGPFAWMQPFLNTLGFVEGSTLKGAVPTKSDGKDRVSEAEASDRRKEAADNLQNIGQDERDRRDRIGNIMLVVSAMYTVWASLIADDGGLTGHALRALLALPLFFATGFKLSAQEGL